MPARPPNGASPTKRQAEYLAFIRAFTDRWGIPPSFEEIGRHFTTTAPSVNNMVKTLETRGFLTRIPGRARTLRVILPERPYTQAEPPQDRTVSRDIEVATAVQLASLVIERLVPALQAVDERQLSSALDAVSDALETVCLAAGAPDDQRKQAQATLRRIALIAQGMSPETRPERKLPGWCRSR